MSVATKEPRASARAEQHALTTSASPTVQARRLLHNQRPALPARRDVEPPKVLSLADGYEITVSTRPCPRLPELCFGALATAGLGLRSLSIAWDQDRAGWQRLTIVTRPGTPDAAARVADLLAWPE